VIANLRVVVGTRKSQIVSLCTRSKDGRVVCSSLSGIETC